MKFIILLALFSAFIGFVVSQYIFPTLSPEAEENARFTYADFPDDDDTEVVAALRQLERQRKATSPKTTTPSS
uniref:Uncharacterized protein n=1 Tax=Tetranychus urticae TaxID=32264 RepID=T1KG52_TETUR